MTQRMLAFARKQELTLEAIDLAAVVSGITELLSRTISADVVIDTEFPPALPSVHADRAQLELALLNLVVNARDAMPAGGRIVVGGAPAN